MKHLKSRKHHSKAYRKEAVELLLTGRTLRELAAELQVGVSTLQDWKQEYLAQLEQQPADVASLSTLQLHEELKRLRKENEKLKLHQEILKKAMGILSEAAAGRYALIQAMAPHYPLKDLCLALCVPRSSYYAWQRRVPGRRAQATQSLRTALTGLFKDYREVYGSPRLTVCLRRLGIPCSRNRVARHMRALNLKARQKRAFRPKTTDAHHPHPIAPNVLARRPRPTAVNRVWVSDITYVFTQQGWLYLAAVMDLYSRKVVGWATANHLQTSLVTTALTNASRARAPQAGLLHHSDRGCQYASTAYRSQLASLKALPSMSGKGNCYDNAAMESFWSTLKTEWLQRQQFQTYQQAQLAIFDYIETFYNPKRLHSALGYLSPVDYERTNHHE